MRNLNSTSAADSPAKRNDMLKIARSTCIVLEMFKVNNKDTRSM